MPERVLKSLPNESETRVREPLINEQRKTQHHVDAI
jgi:hypothetical protein